MRTIAISLLCLLLAACQVDPYTHQPDWTGTDWFDAGKEDALSGAAIKSNETLADTYHDSEVDRSRYLKGYKTGQEKICREDLLFAWGMSGKIFPVSCDTVENNKELRQAWQQGMDEGTQSSRLN